MSESNDVFHFGGSYYSGVPDAFSWVGETSPTVRCGAPRADVLWVRTFVEWANAHVQERPCCPECTRIVAVETGAVAGNA